MNTGNLSRRDFLAGAAGAFMSGTSARAFQAARSASKTLYAYVGSFTKGPQRGAGGGGGISTFTVDMNDGSLTQVGRTGSQFDGLHAGGLCISPDGRVLYCTQDTPNLDGKAGLGGGVLAFAIHPTNGALTHLNTQPSMGVNPCFIIIDKTGKRIVVANHGELAVTVMVEKRNGVPVIENVTDDATIAMFAVKVDGALEPACDVGVFERRPPGGSGRGAAAHGVIFDNTERWAIATDNGRDHLYAYPFDPNSRSFGSPTISPTAPGRAPRHMAFHPRLPYLFVCNERESSVSSFHFDTGTGALRPIASIPTIPSDFAARNAPADIRVHPNGKFIYVSNRGHDSIAVVGIDEATGKPAPVETASTLGRTPWEFGFEPSGRFLFVGNQATNQIVTFAVDPDSGRITPTGARADVQRPGCALKFVML
jgi:6-phosphogluconolactonase